MTKSLSPDWSAPPPLLIHHEISPAQTGHRPANVNWESVSPFLRLGLRRTKHLNILCSLPTRPLSCTSHKHLSHFPFQRSFRTKPSAAVYLNAKNRLYQSVPTCSWRPYDAKILFVCITNVWRTKPLSKSGDESVFSRRGIFHSAWPWEPQRAFRECWLQLIKFSGTIRDVTQRPTRAQASP